MVYAEHLVSFWESEIDRGCLCDQLPMQTLGAESLQASLVDNISQCYHSSLLEEFRLHWERTLENLHLVLLHVPFRFADFAWCPFTIISHSLEYDCAVL